MDILEEIIAFKKIEVEKSKDRLPLDKLKSLIKQKEEKVRPFYKTLKNKVDKKEVALIAEIKKASPSKGIIRKEFNPKEIAVSFQKGGAVCLSVLTDKKYFQGDLSYIPQVKEAVDLPVLRKDFIIDPYQIYESIYHEADCILLVVGACHGKPLLRDLYYIACENEIDCLIEVHDEREMEIALDIVVAYHGTPLLGINNRNLKTFQTNLNTTINLVTRYKKDLDQKLVVSESGIFTKDDIKYLMNHGVYAFLVGEALMKEEDLQKATMNLVT